MPRIPTYDPGQVKNNALPEVRQSGASAASFGAADGQAMEQLGNAGVKLGYNMGAIANEEIERNNRMMARAAVNEAEASARAFFAQEVATKQGQDAFGATETTQKFFEKLAKDMDKKLPMAGARDIFQQQFGDLHSRYSAKAFEHSFAEKKKFEVQTIEADNYNITQRMLEGDYSPDDAARLVKANIGYVNQGAPPEKIKADQDRAEKSLNEAYMDHVAVADAQKALDYLETKKGKYSPTYYISQKKKLESILKDQQIKGLVNEVVSSDMSEIEAYATIQERFKGDYELQQNAMREAKSIYNYKAIQQQAAQQKEFNDNLSKIVENPMAEIQAKDPVNALKLKDIKFQMLERERIEKERSNAISPVEKSRMDAQGHILYSKAMAMPIDDLRSNIDKIMVGLPTDLRKDVAKRLYEEDKLANTKEEKPELTLSAVYTDVEQMLNNYPEFSLSATQTKKLQPEDINAIMQDRAKAIQAFDAKWRALPVNQQNKVNANKIMLEIMVRKKIQVPGTLWGTREVEEYNFKADADQPPKAEVPKVVTSGGTNYRLVPE